MPEGPELLYFSTLFKKKFKNTKIVDILSYTDKPVIIPKDFIGNILDVDCKGKQLWFYVDGKNKNYYIHIHYGITGWLTFDKPEKYIKYEFVIQNKKELRLYMEDIRRFSKIKIIDESEHNVIINKLGVDIFTENFTLNKFTEIINSKNVILVGLLLNQSFFCGIGNYIKNESMYLSKIKAKIKTSELSNDQIETLYHNLLFVAYSNLIEMLRNNGLEKYLSENKKIFMPKKLEVPYVYKIYGREETDSGKKVIKIKVSGRDTYCIKELC